MRTTTNYNLKVPETADTILGSIGDYADDLDSLDTILKGLDDSKIIHIADEETIKLDSCADGIYIADGTVTLENYDDLSTENNIEVEKGTIILCGYRYGWNFIPNPRLCL